ncbi:MAG: hypothetical protein ACPHID_08240 [Thermoplasmatota archaeon]
MDLLDDDGLLDLRRRGASRPEDVVADVREQWQTLPDSNADLTAWSGQRPEDGSCYACTRDEKLRCRSCQRPACASHSWVMLGVCRECATDERMSRFHKPRETSEQNWLEEP